MKLRHAFDLYLKLDRSEQTLRTYVKILGPLVREIGPGRPLDNITPEDLDAYVADLRARRVRYADHPRRPQEEGPLATSTLNHHVKTIRAFFNWCTQRGYIEISPARFLRTKKFSRPLGQGKAATTEEVERILAAAHKPRDRAIVLLLAQSGCRAGEVASLRMDFLDLERCRAVIDGKGDKRRVIVFRKEAAQALADWLEVRPKAPHPYVFTSSRGLGPLKTASISEIIRRLSKRAGLSRSLGAHSFRHYVGMEMARRHVSPVVIKEYLGHANVETTMGYLASIVEEDLHAAAEVLPPLREQKNAPDIGLSAGGMQVLSSKAWQNSGKTSRGARI